MNRTKNALRNISWGFIQKICALLLPFLTRTVLIKVLGADYLGLSSLFTSILGLLSLVELGISNAIISSMYKPIADNDTDTICALMAFYRKAYYLIGIFVLIVGLGLTPFLDRFINGEIPNDINLQLLYLIYLFNTSVSYFLFSYKNCLFVAHQRNDVNSKIQTICSIVQNFLQVFFVIFVKNYYGFAVLIPVSSISVNLITAYLAKKTYPEYVIRGKLSSDVKADIKQRVMGLLLGKISSTIRSSIDSLFVSVFLGLKLVAIYSNYFYVVTSVAGIIQILESSLVAGVGNSITVDSVDKNHDVFLKCTFILQWIVGWCSICVLCLEQQFMELWVGKEYMLGDTMVILCALYLFVCCISIIRSIYTQALGMWWSLRHLSLIDIFVNIGLNYFLGKNLGVYGILLATIIDIAFVSIPWTTYFLFRDYFGIKHYSGYMKLYLKYFAIATSVGFITWKLCSWISINSNILALVARAIICVIVPNILYIAIFNRNHYFRAVLKNVQMRFSI